MTDAEVIQRLFDTGHFYSPGALAYGKVSPENLDTLTLHDPVVFEAARSYQDFMRLDLEPFVYRFHKRMLAADGIVGPATREQMQMPRCAVPDYPDPDHAIGDGSWPQPCQKGGVKVHFDTSSMPSVLQPRWEKIKSDVLAIYADVGLNLVEVASKSDANITMWWTFLAGSTIGIAQFNSESCSDVVTCRLDIGYTGYVASLLAHEIGHNCNLQHRSQGGIMHPSIRPDPVPFSFRNDPSFQDCVRFFGGEPITPPGPPPPPPGPIPAPTLDGTIFAEQFSGGIAIRGEVTHGKHRYIAVPVAGVGGQYKFIEKPVF